MLDVADRVAVLTLNRPEVRNALSQDLRQDLRETIEALDDDPGVDAIILTGADPAFCSGFDLRELATSDDSPRTVAPLTKYPDRPLVAPFVSTSTPLIGAINGAAYTGGLELLLHCHIVIASDRATFADTHASRSSLPGWGLTVLLSEAIGVRRALEMSVSSAPIDAKLAESWGLVNHVVPHDQLLSYATALARKISSNNAAAVQRTVRLYNDQSAVRNGAAWRLAARAFIG
jgi:enoyl-CoA hydratase